MYLIALDNCYVWEDSDGTNHYFHYIATDIYKDEDGLELTLTVGSTNDQKYTITDKFGNKSIFDNYGRLRSQVNNQNTSSNITITYTTAKSNLISTVTDGVGRVYKFSYNGSDLLEQISYTGTGTTDLSHVNFTYDTNCNLITVTDQDSKNSTYTYAENHLLQSAQDIDGYKLSYTYTSTDESCYNRIETISENDGTTQGTHLRFEYAHNQTKITEFYGDLEDEENQTSKTTQLIQFNNLGNTVSIQDDQGHAQYAQYAINDPTTDETSTADTTETSNTAKGNQLKLASRLQNTVGNLLLDSSFENGTTWTATNNNVAQTSSSSTAYLGSKSLRIENSVADNEGVLTTFTAEKNTTYTFSAYVKVGTGSAYLAIKNGTAIVGSSEALEPTDEWARLEVCYTNEESSTATLSACLLSDNGSTAYLDCVQIEKAPTASRYNILQNGDFTYANHAWSADTDPTTTDPSTTGPTTADPKAPAAQLDSSVYALQGNPSAANRISQTVNLSGSEGDAYVLAGWAKADSAPIRDDREFGLIATFMNSEEVVNTSTVRFNDCADSTIEWQYVSAAVVAQGAYDSILIEVAYDYNVNTANFDGIQLFKEEFGNSYTYDEDGNVVSIKDLQSQTTTYEYTNNDLTKQILPTGAELTYTYDDYHNVLTATSDTGIVYSFEYDTYGNNTSVSITSGDVTLTSTATYSGDGNRLASTTDAAGKVTIYGYNENTNVLEWVQYPEDTESTRTVYTYDEMYRLATAASAIDTDTTLSASYTYEDDLLKSITTGSTTYNFAYGDFALRSGIMIGDRTLATYTYTQQDHYLNSLDYGNGDHIYYTYNDHGRLTGQSYEDGDTVTYQYDNNGALATVTDSATGISTTYYYDLTDRLMKYAEKGSNFSHIIGYVYDNINNLNALIENINGTSYTTFYAYDDDNRVTSVANGNVNETYTYDGFGRLSGKTTMDGSNIVLTDTITYRNPTDTTTSGQVASLKSTAAGYDVTYSYTYDDNGNILSVSDGTNTTAYTYDKANQLIREDNQAANTSWTWEYDDAGNITSRAEYAYTTGELGTPIDTVSYTYDETWGDLLTGYDGSTITSDTIGNMTAFNGWTFTWEHGRELATISDGTGTWTNTYNADGLRTKRTDGTTTYSYVYNGSSLSQMSVGTHLLNFVYDASGSPMAVTYDGATYYYVTNLQGDVVAILDSAGTAVVQYTYDAWGKPLSTTGTLATTLGVHNPLRYRGYVYDFETQLYYLQSRYYDPQLGRFINADNYPTTGQGLTGNNMFAYCGNNPVSRNDDGGEFWEIVIGAAAGGAVAGAIIGAVSHLVACGRSGSEVTAAGVINAAATGAFTGAIGAIGGAFGGAAALAASAGVGVISGVITAINIDGSAAEKVAMGMTSGIVAGFGTYLGTLIPVALDSMFTLGFTSFTGGMFMGAQTEMVNVVAQQVVSDSFDSTTNTKSPLRPSANRSTYRIATAY